MKQFTLVSIICLTLLVAGALADQSGQMIVVENPEDTNNEAAVVSKVETAFEMDETVEEFVPTREWQKLKPNQPIPKGLHVRLNIQTGEREAKLLDEADAPSSGSNPNEEATQRANRLKANLEESLKNLELDANMESELKDVDKTKKFRTYEEIKKEMEGLDLGVKTDNEVLTQLVAKFKEAKEKDEKLSILEDFEYYVHQYDNGLLLCDLGGFNELVKTINSTDSELEVKMQSLLVIGSAIQSNPKVQIYAIKANILKLLFVHLKDSLENFNLKGNEYQSRLLFVLSGLLRNFPLAQSEFIQMGGVGLLGKIISHDGSSVNRVKIMIKVLTLADDLVKEKVNALKDLNSQGQASNETAAKIDQYKQLEIKEKLLEGGWCGHYKVLLENANEHDQREKILDSMISLAEDCKLKWSNNDVLRSIVELDTVYKRLSSEETKEGQDGDNYFAKMSEKVDFLHKTLLSNSHQPDRSDL